jgi:phosphoribosyl 1,2-cyclic phosphodiesterase
MSLCLRFWGTRGSIPSPGPQTVRYGGNTPCVEVRTSDGRLIIFDAGTGIRPLGRALMKGGPGTGIKADVFVTHAHWDHIQGIPFFTPLFAPGNQIRFWGSSTLDMGLDKVMQEQMSPAVFPVPFDQLAATVEFCEVNEGVQYGSGYELTAMQVRHPGGALGYRVSDEGGGDGAVVYISDNELGVGGDYSMAPQWRSKLTKWIKGARVLVHDATYTEEEYVRHHGWGHSTCDQAVDLALESEVETLVLHHHEPDRSDEELDRVVIHCADLVKRRGGKLSVIAATEGMQVNV